MNLIVAVGEKWGIEDNNLLASIPETCSISKEKTTDGVVVMAQNPLESLPLPEGFKRINYALTSNSGFEAEMHSRIARKNCSRGLSSMIQSMYLSSAESIYKKFAVNTVTSAS